jgi:hypothetical protein
LEYVTDLHKRVMKECDNFSEDVKYWAEYKTGIKEFRPWLESAEKKSQEGLSKPQDLDEALAMLASVTEFNQSCLKNLKVLNDAATAANKMTTHKVKNRMLVMKPPIRTFLSTSLRKLTLK